MQTKRALRVALFMTAIVAAALTLAGCAAKSGSCAWGDPDTGLILEYRMSEGDPISYRFTSNSVQTMDVQGQLIPIESVEILSFTAEPKGMKGADNALGITIDDLTVKASTPQGDAEADASDVVGKSFDMTLSRLGLEGGLPDPDDLLYTIGAEGPKSVITGFKVIFPDLSESPLVVGDTWPVQLLMTEENDLSTVIITINAVNTFVGTEVFDGYKCAKMSSTLTGTIKGSGTQGGVEWTMSSDLDGIGTWYFAYEEGILIRDWTEGTADGSIVVASPDGEMTMPVSREYDMLTELLTKQ